MSFPAAPSPQLERPLGLSGFFGPFWWNLYSLWLRDEFYDPMEGGQAGGSSLWE